MGTTEKASAVPTRTRAVLVGAVSPSRFRRKKSQMSAAIAQSPTYGAHTQKSSSWIIPWRVASSMSARSSAVALLRCERMNCWARTIPHIDPTGLNICAKFSRLTAVDSSPSEMT